jgi:hypothetical protein
LLVGIFAAMELEHSKVSGLVGEVSYAVRHIINLMALLANELSNEHAKELANEYV